MILYHGTNADFSKIELKACKPFKDFGQGFNLTDIKAQAEALAVKRVEIFGGKPIVMEYNRASHRAEVQEAQQPILLCN